MSDKRDKPSIGFWATVILAPPLLYVFSTVPMIYLHDAGLLPDFMNGVLDRVYYPVFLLLWYLGVKFD
jgi:hypothetical protein